MLITISQTTPQPPQTYEGDMPTLRGWYSRAFTAGDGVTPVLPGNGAAGTGFFYDIECSVNNDNLIVIPEFTIQATEDGNLPTALFTGQLFQESGAPGQVIFGNPNGAPSGNGWRIPTLFGDNVTWANLFVYNQTYNLLNAPPSYATIEQVMLLIEQFAGDFDYARVGHAGITELSYAPADASHPIAVGTNDPRMSAFSRLSIGTATLTNGDSGAISFPSITANSVVLPISIDPGVSGTPVVAITAGVGFEITSTNIGDNGSVRYVVLVV